MQTEAYRKGVIAANWGDTTNPYPPGSVAYYDWNNGYYKRLNDLKSE